MPFANDAPLITLMIVAVFLLVLLSRGYVGDIRDWVKAKVAE